MSVVNGQAVDAPVTNAAFMSRNSASTSTIAIVSLNNTDPASGPVIANLQASVNSSEKQVQNLTSILGGASITISEDQGENIIFVSSNAGSVTLSSTPFGASFAGLDGTRVTLCGLDDTNTVTLLFADIDKGALLNGRAVLTQGDSLTLVWSTTLDRWVEINRSF